MRLITIGRSKSSTICINNEYVSANHAQLLLLDNGEILLTDCGSLHGTYVNGRRIEPHVEVPVKKGDKIDFDKAPLNWAEVPSIKLPDPTVVKGVYGVGKAKRNRFILSGESVSRYHATFKEMKNGRWYINDHSTNGTYVNGQRIPANVDYKITHNDNIICGTVPCPNPVPKPGIITKISVCVGAIAAAILLVWGLKITIQPTHKVDPEKATALVTVGYKIRVEFEDDLSDELKSILGVEDWYIHCKDPQKDPVDLMINSDYATTYYHTGTAFFISPDGLMITNKHVTNAIWADQHYSRGQESKKFKLGIENIRQEFISSLSPKVRNLLEDELSLWYKSSFKLVPTEVTFGIRYSGRTYSNISEFDWAHLVAEAENDDVDIAAIRLNSRKTPDFASYFRLDDAITNIAELRKNETYYTIGYPRGAVMATIVNRDYYRPTSGHLTIAQDPSKYQIIMMGNQTVGGQSGSAIFDKKNRLIGVLWGGYNLIESTCACPIRHAVELVKDIMQDENDFKTYKSSN